MRLRLTNTLRLLTLTPSHYSSMAAHRKQASLDGFIKGKGPMTAAAADPSPSTSSGGKKRPRTDGTDVPPEAKKPRAYGTYAAFPANPPEPNEVREGGHKSVLAKLESVMAAQSKLKAGLYSVPCPTQRTDCILFSTLKAGRSSTGSE